MESINATDGESNRNVQVARLNKLVSQIESSMKHKTLISPVHSDLKRKFSFKQQQPQQQQQQRVEETVVEEEEEYEDDESDYESMPPVNRLSIFVCGLVCVVWGLLVHLVFKYFKVSITLNFVPYIGIMVVPAMCLMVIVMKLFSGGDVDEKTQ
eukprot:TRINITY_DN1285_c1_g1_i2.p1 TRINITY_DN1285_c1_g1~~TRINITY_DN1285_c1_g1_i2.p1  ORF type:complete len:154 (+),score=42.97 TRINITY_DN1285_c1_g1_i2:78-539(+)